MITCPICGSEARVRGSESNCEATYRRRKCVDCGYVIYTEEAECKGAKAEYYEAKHKHVKEYKQRMKK